ncbi:MAG: sugar phosphate isomerase/epimerase [Bryobacterales bacterium]|nr:sugar phosphate isomerase/epimerase [Bryobacterales bacterium]
MDRRKFVTALAAMAAAAPGVGGASRLPIRKAVLNSMLPRTMNLPERFRLALDCGFEEMECQAVDDPHEADAIANAASKVGLRIHSVMNMAHWKYPLSSADPRVVEISRKGMETSLRNAKQWGAETVLLVPAVVNAETGYRDAWTRSQREVTKMIPLAEELGIVIAVENVWNKFLLSPIEFRDYVDSFRSRWVRAYFDIGNVVLTGFPQDWIRTLGSRIVKLHVKDFTFAERNARFVPLREGEIDWPAVHKALSDIGFKGSATVELPGGDEAYLREVSRRVDLILNGA